MVQLKPHYVRYHLEVKMCKMLTTKATDYDKQISCKEKIASSLLNAVNRNQLMAINPLYDDRINLYSLSSKFN